MSEHDEPTRRNRDALGGHSEPVTGRTGEYLAKILEENQRLRALIVRSEIDLRRAADRGDRVAAAEHENMKLREKVAFLRDQLQHESARADAARDELARIRTEQPRLGSGTVPPHEGEQALLRHVAEVESHNMHLTYLYIASYRLHTAQSREEALSAISETLVNLVGTEHFAVYEMGGGGDALEVASSVGTLPADLATIRIGVGPIGEAVALGRVFVAGAGETLDGRSEPPALRALIPLTHAQGVAGAIAIFDLLPQKNGAFEDADLELFDLLATDAARALRCAGAGRSAPGTN